MASTNSLNTAFICVQVQEPSYEWMHFNTTAAASASAVGHQVVVHISFFFCMILKTDFFSILIYSYVTFNEI